jgi:hypothetical protein
VLALLSTINIPAKTELGAKTKSRQNNRFRAQKPKRKISRLLEDGAGRTGQEGGLYCALLAIYQQGERQSKHI